jgi:hypothetical protein
MLVRLALFVSLVLALWTVGRPAMAMPAGLCDDRGASAIAQVPSFEAPDLAIRRAMAGGSCRDEKLPVHARIVPAHSAFPSLYGTAHYALSVDLFGLEAGPGEAISVDPGAWRPLSGVRGRVERPPRG